MATDTDLKILTGSCSNEECVRNDPDSEIYAESWDVPCRVEEMVITGEEAFSRFPITTTHHNAPLDDSTLTCPDCGYPALLQDGAPPKYPKRIG